MVRVEPVTLIVAALAAGGSAGALSALQDDVGDAARAVYAKLRGLVEKRVAGNRGAELALAEYEADPMNWEAPLAAKLTQLGAADDADIVAAAGAVMGLIDSVGERSGKYNVTIEDSRGVQVGDQGFQVNAFRG
jgi:hypothetical protein